MSTIDIKPSQAFDNPHIEQYYLNNKIKFAYFVIEKKRFIKRSINFYGNHVTKHLPGQAQKTACQKCKNDWQELNAFYGLNETWNETINIRYYEKNT